MARIDGDLPVFEAPHPVPALDTTQPGLGLTAQAGDLPFLVEGALASAGGRERGAVEWIRIGGRRVAADLAADAGPPVNVVATPGLLRRERVGRLGSVIETLMAAPSLPLAALQWRILGSSGPGFDPEALRLTMRLWPGAPGLRYRVEDDSLVAVSEAHPDVFLAVAVDPVPESWSVGEDPDGGLRVAIGVEDGGPVTLLVASGPRQGVGSALGAARHLTGHAARAGDPPEDVLSLHTGVRELDEGVAWAAARVSAALHRPHSAAGELFWAGLGALAAGDSAGAARALEGLEAAVGEAGDPDVEPTARMDLPREALAPLLAARYGMTAGDPDPALRHAARLSSERAEALRRASGAAAWSVWRLTARSLARALRHAASDEEIRRLEGLEALAPSGPDSPRPSSGGVRLPMAGEPAAGPAPGADPGGLLAALLDGVGRTPPGTTLVAWPDTTPGLEAWHGMGIGDVEAGWLGWREEIARGLSGGPTGRGSWDPAESAGAPEAGILLAALVHGLMGVRPDAPVGRIELAPRLPAHLRGFRMDGILLGSTRVSLRYRKEGETHRFDLEPSAGRVPANVVLSPSIPVTGEVTVLVDGGEADLEATEDGPHRIRVSVQLPLDAPRSLSVVGG